MSQIRYAEQSRVPSPTQDTHQHNVPLNALRIVFAGVLILAFGFVDTLSAQQLRWVAQGDRPTTQGQVEGIRDGEVSGAIHAVAPHPRNTNIVYVGAVNGGIWKSTNAMQVRPSWTQLTDSQDSMSIGALEFDPTDTSGETLVAGIGLYSNYGDIGGALIGVIRTTDGGQSWTTLNGGGALAGLNISGVAPSGATIVVSADGTTGSSSTGIWRSTRTGATWSRISGATNSRLPEGDIFDLASDPNNTARLFANAGEMGVYRSDDTGATWDRASSGDLQTRIEAGASNIQIVVGGSDNVYVAIVDWGSQLSGLFRSGDGGNTWVELDMPETREADGRMAGIHPGAQGQINLSIIADPSNANIVYIGGDRQPCHDIRDVKPTPLCFPNTSRANNWTGRLFRVDASQPRGSQATHITHSHTRGGSAPHADSRDMAFAANGQLIEVNDGGIYRRTNPRANNGDWFSMNGDIQTTEFHSVAWDAVSDIIIGGSQDTGAPEQEVPANARWRTVLQGDGGMVAIDDTSTPGESIRYTSTYYLFNFQRETFDARNDFVRRHEPALRVIGGPPVNENRDQHFPFYPPIELNAVDATRMVIGSWNGVYESRDQGDNLTLIQPPITVNNREAGYPIAYGSRGNPDILYVGTDTRIFIRRAAGGRLVESTLYPGSTNPNAGDVKDLAVDPNNPNSAFVVEATRIYRTQDTGGRWQEITGNLRALRPGIIRSVTFADHNAAGVLLIGADRGVFMAPSPNFITWQRLGTGMPKAPVLALDYDDTDKIILAGTLGRGAWTLKLSEIFRLAGTLFTTGSAQLSAEARRQLGTLIADIRRIRQNFVRVHGYTDSVGNASANQRLSEQRAQAVADWLVAQGGLPRNAVHVVGHGEARSIATNTTAAGRARNRRVEIEVAFLPSANP